LSERRRFFAALFYYTIGAGLFQQKKESRVQATGSLFVLSHNNKNKQEKKNRKEGVEKSGKEQPRPFTHK
jgi:hypothetical protein